MKMKAVCEETGLTSRAVRVYIEEGLISPAYTENYLGRRTFIFEQEDISSLQNIATLRKYGFSIGEIRAILSDPQNSISIIQNVKTRTQKQADDDRDRLNALSLIEDNKAYSVPELSGVLSQSKTDPALPTETFEQEIKRHAKQAAIFGAVWAPFMYLFLMLNSAARSYRYPKIDTKHLLVTLLALLPSVCVLILPKIKIPAKAIIKKVLLTLCVLSIPYITIMMTVTNLGGLAYSETFKIENYRRFDSECLANRNTVFQSLFPTWPRYFEIVETEDGRAETRYLGACYYYHFFRGLDSTCDIYAEWPLEEDDYATEVTRVKDVFSDAVANRTYGYSFVETEKGDFSCLILYHGDAPFQTATDNYAYLIFAYNDTTHTVRYIFCESLENGVDQPYYLLLEW